MASALMCDICGKLYKPYGQKIGDKNGIRFIRVDSDWYTHNLECLDCCEECLNAIKGLIEYRKEK